MRYVSGMLVLVALGLVAVGQEQATQAHGTVNELMIGIIDPSTNTVGYAAFVDPEAPDDEPGIDPYGGWLKVETAAIAMAESANLLMLPGRLCSNGQSAPVDQEDWIAWTQDLRNTGLAAYAAAGEESMDTLLDMADEFSASCVACHTRYVDVGGDPSNRCMP